jgi:hypothetical protein
MSRIASVVFGIAMMVPVYPALAQLDYGFAFTKAGSAGFQSLKIGLGARESALGEAASSLTNDANAVFWNVGALPLIEGPQAYFSHTDWLVESTLDAVVLAAPIGPYAVGLSMMHFGIDKFEETTVLEPDGTGRMVGAGDYLFGLAAARRFTDRLTIGVQAKYMHEKLDGDSYGNVLFDVGTLYYTGFRQLRLAFSLQHFGATVEGLRQDFRMPLLARLSAADEIVSTAQLTLTAAVELVHPTDNEQWVNFGLEALVLDVVALRGGYRNNVDEGRLSLGMGISTPRVAGFRLIADYAYVDFGEVFDATHRLTFGIER